MADACGRHANSIWPLSIRLGRGRGSQEPTIFSPSSTPIPASASYGHLVATAVTDQVSMQVHHTEYAMPESGLLFANDHLAGRTFVFDVRDPLHPKVSSSFTDMAGYEHPHSFLRLPNGHVLASFQHMQHAVGDMQMNNSGGLVEIDDQGHVIRAASSADPAFPDALLMPYSLLPTARDRSRRRHQLLHA
jgi:hypothetical protein